MRIKVTDESQKTDDPPASQDFVFEKNTTKSSNVQSDFTGITNGNDLICVQPPADGDYWPYGDNPSDEQSDSSSGGGMDTGDKIGLAVGIVLGVFFIAVLAWYVRKWALQRNRPVQMSNGWNQKGFMRGKI